MEISSKHNPTFKKLLSLTDKRGRTESALFLIEGFREITRAVDAGWPLESVYYCPPLFLGENEPALLAKIEERGASAVLLAEPLFRRLAYRDRPEGLIAVGKIVPRTLADLTWKKESSPLFLIAEAIEKPGNLGTMVRSADAAGADALIIADRCTDIYNPNVVRASVGTLFSVPIVEASGEEVMDWLTLHKISACAASPHAKESYTKIDLRGPLAVLVGTEQLGLSEKWMERSDLQVRIPMHGIADSLNVATAATLVLYEARRQREG